MGEVKKLKTNLSKCSKELTEMKNIKDKHEGIIKDKDSTIKTLKNKIEISQEEFKIQGEENIHLKMKILKIEKEYSELKELNKNMNEDIEFMKQREIERIQQLDLDDIDLVSQGIYIFIASLNV